MLKIRNKKKWMEKRKWYWYRGIPFVIAKVKNPEWDKIKKVSPLLKETMNIYNSDGSWYILENPFYWFFGINIGDFCFYDSLHLEHSQMPDDLKWLSLINYAEADIDELYSKLNFLKYKTIWKKKK